MPVNKEAEPTKPRYELRPRDQQGYYALLCEGEHNLCAICTKTTRGVLDAQLILLVMNSHKDLLDVCKKISIASKTGTSITNCLGELEAAIVNTKPKPEQESTL